MRKLLVLIMMLVMLSPSLACAMPVCADEAQAAATERPCAGHPPHQSEEGSEVGKVNLLKDCMGVDLQGVDNILVKKQTLQSDIFFASFMEQESFSAWTPVEAAGIRGPPPDWPDVSQFQPSLILTTQRFRI